MENKSKSKKSNYQLNLKRLIALILIVTFSFTTISPVYASRAGNFGESSAFSQTISGAYSGAQLSSDFGSGAFWGMAATVGVAAVDLWYYVNYYSDYGKTLISFDVGGTRVDISRGQMVRMVGSVAVNAMVGLARGGGISVGSVVDACVTQFVSLLVQEIVRDILVRKFGMDPNFAGIIASIVADIAKGILKKYYVSAGEEKTDEEGNPVEPNGLGAWLDKLIDPKGKQLQYSRGFIKGLQNGVKTLVHGGNARKMTPEQLREGKRYADETVSRLDKQIAKLKERENKYSKGFYERKLGELNKTKQGYERFSELLTKEIDRLKANAAAQDGSPVTVPSDVVVAGLIDGFVSKQEDEESRRHPEEHGLQGTINKAVLGGIGMVKGPQAVDEAKKVIASVESRQSLAKAIGYTGNIDNTAAFQKAIEKHNRNVETAIKIGFRNYNPQNRNNQEEFQKALNKYNASAQGAPIAKKEEAFQTMRDEVTRAFANAEKSTGARPTTVMLSNGAQAVKAPDGSTAVLLPRDAKSRVTELFNDTDKSTGAQPASVTLPNGDRAVKAPDGSIAIQLSPDINNRVRRAFDAAQQSPGVRPASVTLPNGTQAVRVPDRLELTRKNPEAVKIPDDYELTPIILLPGMVPLAQGGNSPGTTLRTTFNEAGPVTKLEVGKVLQLTSPEGLPVDYKITGQNESGYTAEANGRPVALRPTAEGYSIRNLDTRVGDIIGPKEAPYKVTKVDSTNGSIVAEAKDGRPVAIIPTAEGFKVQNLDTRPGDVLDLGQQGRPRTSYTITKVDGEVYEATANDGKFYTIIKTDQGYKVEPLLKPDIK